MVKTRGLDRAATKWEGRVAVAGEDYKAGVQAPRKDWQNETSKAAERHKTAMAKAAQEDAFRKGVNATPTATWQTKTLEKGATRWPEGVSKGKSDYAKGMQPVIAAIEATTLPERGPAGDPKNLLRVSAMNEAVRRATKR